jgi:transcriptional regulator with XRE-family HTH domain
MPPTPTFAERLLMHRNRLGLSQVALGEKVGVAQNTISTWESGKSSPGVPELVALCDLFGVSTEYLTGRVDQECGLQAGTFVIDLDKLGKPKPLETWGWEVPRRAKIVSFEEVRRLEAEHDPQLQGRSQRRPRK